MSSPIQPFTEGPHGRVVGARLCQFHTGSAELLGSHKDWITKHFVPKMRQYPNAWVDLIGSVSRSEDASKYPGLSERRIAAVEAFIHSHHPGLRFNRRIPQGASDAKRFGEQARNDDSYYRAAVVLWFGVPLAIDAPQYPPEPESPGIRLQVKKAPRGCWCVVGVDTFGVPLKAGVSIGKADVTLLNDQGELYTLHGVGGGAGVGVDIGPELAEKGLQWVLKFVKELGLKAGDFQNVSNKIQQLKLTGPNDTFGGVFRLASWEANLIISQITGSGFFTIASGEAQAIVTGGEVGLIYFGAPSVMAQALGAGGAANTTWAFFCCLGLGTLKTALGVGCTLFKITGVDRTTQPRFFKSGQFV